jgi:hypothetical protein
VIKTLFEGVGLVVLVVLIFLQSWRASLIPMLAIPVSLVGTFAVMWLAGFSMNNLSLFGLVLAIGLSSMTRSWSSKTSQRWIEEGLPRATRLKAMEEVTPAVIAIAFGLSAVFIPWRLFRESPGSFIAVRADDFVLDAALGVQFAHAEPGAGRALVETQGAGRLVQPRARCGSRLVFRLFNRALSAVTGGYVVVLRRVVRVERRRADRLRRAALADISRLQARAHGIHSEPGSGIPDRQSSDSRCLSIERTPRSSIAFPRSR